MSRTRWTIGFHSVTFCLIACFLPVSVQAESKTVPFGSQWPARDTLSVGEEPGEDARDCLRNLSWTPGTFQVRIDPPARPGKEDALLRFPSPVPGQEAAFATVVMEWSQVRDESGEIATAPGVVVLHESGRKMPVGRMIAQGFQQRGVHAFLLQMPGYGERRGSQPSSGHELLLRMKQGIADARRARDAVAALPCVSKERIALQGTSLGGFAASTTAGLDRGYHSTFLMLSGGDVYGIIQNGAREAAKVREELTASGLSDEELRQIAWSIEPNRLAHRLDPKRTWLYSGLFDQVVPIGNARSLAKAAGLTGEHHFQMPADHYTGIILLPAILDQMAAEILEIPIDQVNSPLKASRK